MAVMFLQNGRTITIIASGADDTLRGIECDHSKMEECHEGCGHYACVCGISWDESFEGSYAEELIDV